LSRVCSLPISRSAVAVGDQLEEAFDPVEFEAVVSMLAGVVACPSIMFGGLPDDDAIAAAAVDIVPRSANDRG
jgi:hypothetical protein